MAAQSFNCPNCGAPLDYDNSGASTMRCPYCETSVMVPKELRPARSAPIPVVAQPVDQPSARPVRLGRWLFVLIGLTVCFIVTVTVAPVIIAARTTGAVLSQTDSMKSALLTQVGELVTATAQSTDTPAVTATPEIASAGVTFGSKGIGPGLLNDARYIAVDGNGTLYVADYQGGRVQAFDSSGKYLRQWKVGKADTIILGLAANHSGEVFVAFDGSITRYDGATGKALNTLANPNGGEYGDITATADGGLAAVWYEGRWGMITSLEGHRDDLVWYNAQGKLSGSIQSFICGQTGEPALDTVLAVDGSGGVYALSTMDSTIFKFSAEGKFINRFGSAGDQPDQFQSAETIAVDGQGRVYVGASRKILIFSPDGRFLNAFPTTNSIDKLVIDEQGNLWGVSRDQVTEYQVNFK